VPDPKAPPASPAVDDQPEGVADGQTGNSPPLDVESGDGPTVGPGHVGVANDGLADGDGCPETKAPSEEDAHDEGAPGRPGSTVGPTKVPVGDGLLGPTDDGCPETRAPSEGDAHDEGAPGRPGSTVGPTKDPVGDGLLGPTDDGAVEDVAGLTVPPEADDAHDGVPIDGVAIDGVPIDGVPIDGTANDGVPSCDGNGVEPDGRGDEAPPVDGRDGVADFPASRVGPTKVADGDAVAQSVGAGADDG